MPVFLAIFICRCVILPSIEARQGFVIEEQVNFRSLGLDVNKKICKNAKSNKNCKFYYVSSVSVDHSNYSHETVSTARSPLEGTFLVGTILRNDQLDKHVTKHVSNLGRHDTLVYKANLTVSTSDTDIRLIICYATVEVAALALKLERSIKAHCDEEDVNLIIAVVRSCAYNTCGNCLLPYVEVQCTEGRLECKQTTNAYCQTIKGNYLFELRMNRFSSVRTSKEMNSGTVRIAAKVCLYSEGNCNVSSTLASFGSPFELSTDAISGRENWYDYSRKIASLLNVDGALLTITIESITHRGTLSQSSEVYLALPTSETTGQWQNLTRTLGLFTLDVKYRMRCQDGFNGTNCSVPCVHCRPHVINQCRGNLSGPQCAHDFHCKTYCNNSGTCLVKHNAQEDLFSALCICPSDTEGSRCGYVLSSKPCRKGCQSLTTTTRGTEINIYCKCASNLNPSKALKKKYEGNFALVLQLKEFSNPLGLTASGQHCDAARSMCDTLIEVCLHVKEGYCQIIAGANNTDSVLYTRHLSNVQLYYLEVNFSKVATVSEALPLDFFVYDAAVELGENETVIAKLHSSVNVRLPDISTQSKTLQITGGNMNMTMTVEYKVGCARGFSGRLCDHTCQPPASFCSDAGNLCETAFFSKCWPHEQEVCDGRVGPGCVEKRQCCNNGECSGSDSMMVIREESGRARCVDHPADVCSSGLEVCSRAGKCEHTAGQTWCQCLSGYAGKHCQFVDRCRSVPPLCNNNGSCVFNVIDGSAVCALSAPHFGERLTSLPARKGASPKVNAKVNFACKRGGFYSCKNGGTCYQLSSTNFHCRCAAGFAGEFCSIRDLCNPSSCENGASCQFNTLTNSTRCLCTDEFKGDRCELVKTATFGGVKYLLPILLVSCCSIGAIALILYCYVFF